MVGPGATAATKSSTLTTILADGKSVLTEAEKIALAGAADLKPTLIAHVWIAVAVSMVLGGLIVHFL